MSRKSKRPPDSAYKLTSHRNAPNVYRKGSADFAKRSEVNEAVRGETTVVVIGTEPKGTSL